MHLLSVEAFGNEHKRSKTNISAYNIYSCDFTATTSGGKLGKTIFELKHANSKAEAATLGGVALDDSGRRGTLPARSVGQCADQWSRSSYMHNQ